uniref:Uncharacterized protein n=1 Tax=Mycolicibacterium gilvum (strain PYR-GCK) TaxID=350054 RepID=A4TF63_MYCGI|nr:hypothetical protein Mflv_4740 [Mycolicibacterium gilvum PYR-GCK]
MGPSVVAVAVVVTLGLWHLRNRRHPGWLASPDGRFSVMSGYSLTAVAVYWLAAAPTATSWEWAFGNAWTLVAMVSFVYGFALLRQVTIAHAEPARTLESIDASSDSAQSNPALS